MLPAPIRPCAGGFGSGPIRIDAAELERALADLRHTADQLTTRLLGRRPAEALQA